MPLNKLTKPINCYDCHETFKRNQISAINTPYGGARGVMVIIIGNGHGDTSSNPGRDWLHFI